MPRKRLTDEERAEKKAYYNAHRTRVKTTYIIRNELRRLADELFAFVDRHDATDPKLTLEALKEARHLARLAINARAAGIDQKTTGNVLVQLQKRLAARGLTGPTQPAIELTPEKPNGRDTEFDD